MALHRLTRVRKQAYLELHESFLVSGPIAILLSPPRVIFQASPLEKSLK